MQSFNATPFSSSYMDCYCVLCIKRTSAQLMQKKTTKKHREKSFFFFFFGHFYGDFLLVGPWGKSLLQSGSCGRRFGFSVSHLNTQWVQIVHPIPLGLYDFFFWGKYQHDKFCYSYVVWCPDDVSTCYGFFSRLSQTCLFPLSDWYRMWFLFYINVYYISFYISRRIFFI